MQIDLTMHCLREFAVVKQNDTELYEHIVQQLICLQRNPTDSSLQLHILKGNTQEQLWSMLIVGSLRALFYYRQFDGECRAVFVALTFQQKNLG